MCQTRFRELLRKKIVLKFSRLLFRHTLFAIVPIIVLIADLISFPSTFENHPSITAVNLTNFLTKQQLLLGTVRAHRLYLSLDDLASTDYLADAINSKNVLVISGFIQGDRSVSIAALGQAVLKRLNAASPKDYHAFYEELSGKKHIQAGEVVISSLEIPSDKRSVFPVDEIYTIFFTEGSPISTEELTEGLGNAFDVASRRRMENLVLPCLGITWEHSEDAGALSFEDFFSTVFKSIDPTQQSPTLYLSLYRGWPSFELEKAIAGFNSEWSRVASDKGSFRTTLYRAKYRRAILFWFLCLLVCSFVKPPSLKGFLIISVGFLTLALGSHELVDFLTQGRPSIESTGHYATLFVLAVLFPVIVAWDPKEFFKSKPRDGTHG